MSADLLREAATILRERASSVRRPYGQQELVDVALADWLDTTARRMEAGNYHPCNHPEAIALARLIVGEQP